MTSRKWRIGLFAGLAIAVCCGLSPFGRHVRESEPRTYSMNSLKSITLAIQQYHEVFHKLPPAVGTDQDGKPLYSWRVALLPFLERPALYNKFKLDEPWDSPHNQQFLKETPMCYLPLLYGAFETPGTTRYQVFVGPGTAFERPGLRLNPVDFPDGLDKTLLLAEAAEPVPWTKPDDLRYDPQGPLPKLGGQYKRTVRFRNFEMRRIPGFNVAAAAGAVRWLEGEVDEPLLRALITRNGGEKVVWP